MIIRNHNFVFDIPFEQIHYIKVQNLDYPVICPICNYEMKIRDSKRRYIKDETGQKIPLNLKRYYCIRCNKLHTEIPDINEPYKQYDSLTIKRLNQAIHRHLPEMTQPSGIGSGKSNTPTFPVLWLISDFYNCSVDYLLGKTNEQPPIQIDTSKLNDNQIQAINVLIESFIK